MARQKQTLRRARNQKLYQSVFRNAEEDKKYSWHRGTPSQRPDQAAFKELHDRRFRALTISLRPGGVAKKTASARMTREVKLKEEAKKVLEKSRMEVKKKVVMHNVRRLLQGRPEKRIFNYPATDGSATRPRVFEERTEGFKVMCRKFVHVRSRLAGDVVVAEDEKEDVMEE